MSTDYHAFIHIGFHFAEKVLQEAFGQTTDAKTRTEPRYNPKTGKRIEDIEITEEEETVFVLNGETFEDEWPENYWELVANIAKYCGCIFSRSGYDESTIVFGPEINRYDDNEGIQGFSDGRFTIEHGIVLRDVLKIKPKLDKIKAKLKKIGLKVPEPQVHLCCEIG